MTPDEIRKLAEDLVGSIADLDAGDEEFWIAVDAVEDYRRAVERETWCGSTHGVCHFYNDTICKACEGMKIDKVVENTKRETAEPLRAEIARLKRAYWSAKPETVEHVAALLDNFKLSGPLAEYPNAGAMIRAQQAEIARLREALTELCHEASKAAHGLDIARMRSDLLRQKVFAAQKALAPQEEPKP